ELPRAAHAAVPRGVDARVRAVQPHPPRRARARDRDRGVAADARGRHGLHAAVGFVGRRTRRRGRRPRARRSHRGGAAVDGAVPRARRRMMAKRADASAGTPATVALARAGVAFTVHAYEHDPRAAAYGLEAAEKLGLDPDRVFKTLLASVDGALAVGI